MTESELIARLDREFEIQRGRERRADERWEESQKRWEESQKRWEEGQRRWEEMTADTRRFMQELTMRHERLIQQLTRRLDRQSEESARQARSLDDLGDASRAQTAALLKLVDRIDQRWG